MSDAALISLACETNAGFLALGNERFEALGATFIRNRKTPRRQDVNGVVLVRTAPADFEHLLDRMEAEYQGTRHRHLEMDPLSPPAFAARLALDETYREEELLVLVLEGALKATPGKCQIAQVISEDDWTAYRRLDELWWRESSEQYFGPYDPDLHDELSLSFRAKQPSVRSWQAWVDGGARAYLSSWPGENGVGMVEDLYTEPEYRHRGLGTALLARAVADARERGAGPVIINADSRDTPKHMYASLGFKPLYLTRSFTRKLG